MGRSVTPLNEKAINSGELKDVVMGLRVPAPLAKRLDDYVSARGTNRSLEINRAIEFLVSAEECSKCHTLNAAGSHFCSKCHSLLWDSISDLESIVKTYNEILANVAYLKKSLSESYETVKKIKWFVEKQDPNVKEKIIPVFNSLTKGYALGYVTTKDIISQLENNHSVHDDKSIQKTLNDAAEISKNIDAIKENPSLCMLSYEEIMNIKRKLEKIYENDITLETAYHIYLKGITEDIEKQVDILIKNINEGNSITKINDLDELIAVQEKKIDENIHRVDKS